MRRRSAAIDGTRTRHAVAALVAVAALGPAPARALADDLEYQVKAEFVERFTHFVDWPPSAFPSANAPFVLCVVGETPLTAYLEQMARLRRIKGRPVELRRVRPEADLSRCNLLFIAGDERTHLQRILAAVTGQPVLTIADSEGFGRAGVLINLSVDDQGRVRFEISSSMAHRTALTLNAQLLKLARHAEED